MTPSKKAAQSSALPVIRALVRAFQAFTNFDKKQLVQHNITMAQADVLFTLGNTDGMTYKEIGQKTLTSKGTLTGIIERLIDKNIVKKCTNSNDARSQIVYLTDMGDNAFQEIFPQHISNLEAKLSSIDDATKRKITEDLMLLSKALS
jgi:DNA-binding MarR family transcriptional regulator